MRIGAAVARRNVRMSLATWRSDHDGGNIDVQIPDAVFQDAMLALTVLVANEPVDAEGEDGATMQSIG